MGETLMSSRPGWSTMVMPSRISLNCAPVAATGVGVVELLVMVTVESRWPCYSPVLGDDHSLSERRYDGEERPARAAASGRDCLAWCCASWWHSALFSKCPRRGYQSAPAPTISKCKNAATRVIFLYICIARLARLQQDI